MVQSLDRRAMAGYARTTSAEEPLATVRQSGQLKKAFLEHFRTQGNVSRTCRALSINRSTVYAWQEQDDAFLSEFREAEIEATETMEAEAYRRAVEGTLKPVFHQGVQCGAVQEYSDTLMIFLLKARAPQKYRDKSEAEVTVKGGVTIFLPDRQAN